VASVYPKRDPPQALIAAGTLVFGREPCFGYSGWAIATSWGLTAEEHASSKFSGWELGKISQEHGFLFPSKESRLQSILSKNAAKDIQGPLPFKVGQKVRLWPNHACVAASNFTFYAVVDGSSNNPDKIIDVWARCRGW
jgi:D-serine ammonia-lyase